MRTTIVYPPTYGPLKQRPDQLWRCPVCSHICNSREMEWSSDVGPDGTEVVCQYVCPNEDCRCWNDREDWIRHRKS